MIRKDCPSLGPSNDDSDAVRVEMRAAELHASWDPGISPEEYQGWMARHDEGIALDSNDRLAGWLSREIRYADTPRDIGTWSWDISRPLAEQFAATATDDAAADALPVPGESLADILTEAEDSLDFPPVPVSDDAADNEVLDDESDGAP